MTEQKLLTQEEVQARLIEIAKADADLDSDYVRALIEKRDTLFEEHIQPLENRIEDIKNYPIQLRNDLRQDMQEYIALTGHVDLHSLIGFSRKSVIQYDKKAALEWVKANRPEFIRTKQELDKRPFDKAIRNGEIEWNEVEKINQPTVSIPTKLGHLLIGSD